jgi:hypothetical protein
MAPGFLVPAIDSMNATTFFNFPGTSSAAPHVAGLAALLKLADDTRDWKAIRNLLIAGGTPSVPAAVSTISERRLRAAASDGTGSLTCVNQIVQKRLLPPSDASLKLGDELPVAVLSIKCAAPEGGPTRAVNVVKPDGMFETFLLKDNGLSPDRAKADGIYTETFKPGTSGKYKLQFWGSDKDSVIIEVN